MRSAVDTNMISAIWTQQPNHIEAKTILGKALDSGGLVISGIVYAELLAHPRMDSRTLEGFLFQTRIEVDDAMSRAIWREAGDRFRRYADRRKKAGANPHRRLVADFVIGAHALLNADRLITFNGADFRLDFPELAIAPDLPH